MCPLSQPVSLRLACNMSTVAAFTPVNAVSPTPPLSPARSAPCRLLQAPDRLPAAPRRAAAVVVRCVCWLAHFFEGQLLLRAQCA